MVLPGLLLARKCVDVRLDPVVQRAIVQDPGLEKLAEDILEKIRTREAGFSESLSWRFSLLHLRVRDSLPDRIRYLVRLFTMPTVKEWTLYPLPPPADPPVPHHPPHPPAQPGGHQARGQACVIVVIGG